MSANRANFHTRTEMVRVICPKCNAGGAQNINSYQPKCHKCKDVLMHPGSNNKIECTWAELREHAGAGKIRECI